MSKNNLPNSVIYYKSITYKPRFSQKISIYQKKWYLAKLFTKHNKLVYNNFDKKFSYFM